MVNYQNGKIYKLVNSKDNKIYVGGTCTDLQKRLYAHIHKSKIKSNRRIYKHLIIIGWNLVKIELIENYPCNNIIELNKREQYWIDKLQPELNSKPAYIPLCKLSKTYIKYRDSLLKRQSSRIHCECGINIRFGDRCRHYRTKKHLCYFNKS